MLQRLENLRNENQKLTVLYFEFDSKTNALKNGQHGIGKIKYDEGSEYYGSILFNNGNFFKYGYGEQDFLSTQIPQEVFLGPKNLKAFKYVGNYDYTKIGWCYGNGILYFVDKNNKPAAFVKGFFVGIHKKKPFEGLFTKDILLPGFTLDMEIEQDILPRAKTIQEKANKEIDVNTILIGDSWFELYEEYNDNYQTIGTFKEDTEGKSVLNLGIGGSTYLDWVKYAPTILKKINFNQVIINLGLNDLHFGYTPESIIENCDKVIKIIRNKNPNCKIHILSISPTLEFKHYRELEIFTSIKLQKFCEINNINFISAENVFIKENQFVDDYEKFFVPDGLHLNNYGYKKWSTIFKSLF